MKMILFSFILAIIAGSSCAQNMKSGKGHEHNPYYSTTDTTILHVADSEWKKVLPADLYQVARAKNTEQAFTDRKSVV